MKVAKLVTIQLTTRIIIDDNKSLYQIPAFDEKIVKLTKQKFLDKLFNDEILENIVEIKYDEECPYGTLDGDKNG